MSIEIGDRVVCVDDSKFVSGNGMTRPSFLKKGMEYIVQDVTECSCGVKWVSVGIPSNVETLAICGFCMSKITHNQPTDNYYKPERFRKVETRKEYKVVKSEITIQESCLS